jgi:hypothetical protein
MSRLLLLLVGVLFVGQLSWAEPLPHGRLQTAAPGQGLPELVVTDTTEIKVDGKVCKYAEVPDAR